jgi:hypothetical protein
MANFKSFDTRFWYAVALGVHEILALRTSLFSLTKFRKILLIEYMANKYIKAGTALPNA